MKFQFAEFVADEESRLLLRAGAAVHLSPKAFDLLVTLIRERPRVLSKDDLHARLWPDTFVSDASLAMLVAEVRAALGESAREPGAVRTVHRRGYAFQADARELTPAGAVEFLGGPPQGYWLMTPSRLVPLIQGDNIVGREPSAGVWLDSADVSRRHARIRVEGGRITVEDLGSKNGTLVRDVRITSRTAVADGDTLRFGSVAVTVRAWAVHPTLTEGGA